MNRATAPFPMVAVVLAGLLAACSSPDPVLYTIAADTGGQRRWRAGGHRLQKVGLARYLERLQIVQSSENNRLDVQSNDWWGEPLGPMLGRVLIERVGVSACRKARVLSRKWCGIGDV